VTKVDEFGHQSRRLWSPKSTTLVFRVVKTRIRGCQNYIIELSEKRVYQNDTPSYICQLTLHEVQCTKDVIQVGNDHKEDDDSEAKVFCPNHELLAWLATSNHLVKQEQHMTAIERRNR